MQVITLSNAATVSADGPIAFVGAKLTGTDTAQIQDGATREIARLEGVAADPTDVIMLPSPIMINGLIVAGLAGAGTLTIYVE